MFGWKGQQRESHCSTGCPKMRAASAMAQERSDLNRGRRIAQGTYYSIKSGTAGAHFTGRAGCNFGRR